MNMTFQKHFFAFLALVFINQTLVSSQDVESEIWPVTSVAIHEAGAHVSHTGLVSFTGSTVEVEVRGVAADILASTIKVNLQPGVTLQSMSCEVVSHSGVRSESLEEVSLAIDSLDKQVRVFEVEINTLLEEIQFLKANRKIGSHQEVLLVDDVIEMADFLRERNLDIGLEILYAEISVKSLKENLTKLLQIKNELISLGADKEGVVHMTLTHVASKPKTSLVTFSYLTPSASWSPEYEVNYDGSSVTFQRNAVVVQSSGIDWKGADIVLVSGKPSGSLSPAAFDDWIVSINSQSNISIRGARSNSTFLNIDGMHIRNDDDVEEFQDDTFAGSARYHFTVKPHTVINGDGKPVRVEINEFKLPGDVRFYAVPAVSSEGYATVRCPDWLGNDLMKGWAQVVSGNSYLGNFLMELPTVGDTLILPLGANPHVLCSRELKAEDSKSSVFAGKKTVVQTWDLTVENDSDDYISVDLVDKIPRTLVRESDVELTVDVSEGGVVDFINNEVVFPLNLEPFEKKVVTVVLTVKYPSSAKINNF